MVVARHLVSAVVVSVTLFVGLCLVGGVAAATAGDSASTTNQTESLTVGDSTVFVAPAEAELDDVEAHLDAATEREEVSFGDLVVVAVDVDGLPENATFDELSATITLKHESPTPQVPPWEFDVDDETGGVEVVADGTADVVYLVVWTDEFSPGDEVDWNAPSLRSDDRVSATLSVPKDATTDDSSQRTAVEFTVLDRAIDELAPTPTDRDGIVLQPTNSEITGSTTLAPGNVLSVTVEEGERERTVESTVETGGQWTADLDFVDAGTTYSVTISHGGVAIAEDVQLVVESTERTDVATESVESTNRTNETTGAASNAVDGADPADALTGFRAAAATLATLAVVTIGASRRL